VGSLRFEGEICRRNGLDTGEWQLNLMSALSTRQNHALGIGLGHFA
jgi:hypothetical protein